MTNTNIDQYISQISKDSEVYIYEALGDKTLLKQNKEFNTYSSESAFVSDIMIITNWLTLPAVKRMAESFNVEKELKAVSTALLKFDVNRSK